MKTDNELIAEFMGVLSLSETGLWDIHKTGKLIYCVRSNELKYDTSWDWLHPVLEKIEEQLNDLKDEYCIVPVSEDDYSHPWEMPMTTRIGDAYATAVNLIKFLNANQQQP